jgi:NAD(P)-dependent dehydrogenase (short-subunit alcohol dehydrogenase family)
MVERRWTAADVPDQSGRTAVVTGGNTGIGFQVASVLARHGARVVLACRDLEKARQAAARLNASERTDSGRIDSERTDSGRTDSGRTDSGRTDSGRIDAVRLDLASLGSVREAAAEIGARYERVDLLINNAGVMMTPYQRTEDGFELQLGTNHLGPFAFTGLLIDRIAGVPGARVLTVSSIVHRSAASIDLGNLHNERGYNRSAAYARSKLANLLFAYELQRRLAAAQAEAIALAAHPGYASTDLGRHLPRLILLGLELVNPVIAQSAAMGALPVLRAATDATARGGDYYGPGGMAQTRGYPRRVHSSVLSHDEELARRLWSESEKLTGVSYQARLA